MDHSLMPRKLRRMRTVPAHAVTLEPVILLTGGEYFFASRAIDTLRALAAKEDDMEVTRFTASTYTAGFLLAACSPSLFSSRKVVIADDAHQGTDDFYTDAKKYIDAPSTDICFVINHGGGNKGRGLLNALKKCKGGLTVECKPLKKYSDKTSFVAAEFSSAGRKIDNDAVRALVDALGGDTSELASACRQLVSDTSPSDRITAELVNTYHGGRVEATGFKVADAVVAKDRHGALRVVRQAVDSGVNPVPIVGAVAARVRQLLLVGSFQGAPGAAAKELGIPPWQVNRVKSDLRRWSPTQLREAVIACADADEMVKGGGKDPVYAVEKLVMTLTD